MAKFIFRQHRSNFIRTYSNGFQLSPKVNVLYLGIQESFQSSPHLLFFSTTVQIFYALMCTTFYVWAALSETSKTCPKGPAQYNCKSAVLPGYPLWFLILITLNGNYWILFAIIHENAFLPSHIVMSLKTKNALNLLKIHHNIWHSVLHIANIQILRYKFISSKLTLSGQSSSHIFLLAIWFVGLLCKSLGKKKILPSL